MRRILYLPCLLVSVLFIACSESFTDPRDGQSYDIVKIGERTWFAENLNFATAGSVCPEGDSRKCSEYGRLYTWDDARAACPEGWQLPDSADFASLIAEAGGSATAGEKLKSTGGWFKKGNGSDALGFDTGIAGVASGIDLYAVAVDFVAALHHFLAPIVDERGVGLQFFLRNNRMLCGPAIGFMLLFGCSSGFVVSLLLGRGLRRCGLLLLGGYCGLRTVDKFVDGFFLCDGDLAFSQLLLLEPLGEGCLCAGCKDAASAQQPYSYYAFHFFQASMIPLKSAAFNEAPPMRPPSMSGLANSSGAFEALQLPPYRMVVSSATA